jgi:hypothetical protein
MSSKGSRVGGAAAMTYLRPVSTPDFALEGRCEIHKLVRIKMIGVDVLGKRLRIKMG